MSQQWLKSSLAGHNAIIHAATVEDGALVGMGATLLDGSKVRTSHKFSHPDLPWYTVFSPKLWQTYGSYWFLDWRHTKLLAKMASHVTKASIPTLGKIEPLSIDVGREGRNFRSRCSLDAKQNCSFRSSLGRKSSKVSARFGWRWGRLHHTISQQLHCSSCGALCRKLQDFWGGWGKNYFQRLLCISRYAQKTLALLSF